MNAALSILIIVVILFGSLIGLGYLISANQRLAEMNRQLIEENSQWRTSLNQERATTNEALNKLNVLANEINNLKQAIEVERNAKLDALNKVEALKIQVSELTQALINERKAKDAALAENELLKASNQGPEPETRIDTSPLVEESMINTKMLYMTTPLALGWLITIVIAGFFSITQYRKHSKTYHSGPIRRQ